MNRAMIWLCALFCVSGIWQPEVQAQEALTPTERALWDRHWRSYAMRCAEFEGDYLICPTYNRRYPSESGITVRQAEEELARQVRVGGAGVTYTKTFKQPIEEAQAMALPIRTLKVGTYGVLASVLIEEIIDDNSAIVEKVYLLDADEVRRAYREDRKRVREVPDNQREQAEQLLEERYEQRRKVLEEHEDREHRKAVMRLVGFDVVMLEEGERWKGPKEEGLHVVIVKQEAYGSERRPKHRLVAVALDEVRWGLSEQAFVEMIEQRGLDRAGFVALIQQAMAERDAQQGQRYILENLLKRNPATKDETDTQEQDAGQDTDG